MKQDSDAAMRNATRPELSEASRKAARKDCEKKKENEKAVRRTIRFAALNLFRDVFSNVSNYDHCSRLRTLLTLCHQADDDTFLTYAQCEALRVNEDFLMIHPELEGQASETMRAEAATMFLGYFVNIDVVTGNDIGLCFRDLVHIFALPGRMRAIFDLIYFAGDKICRKVSRQDITDTLESLRTSVETSKTFFWDTEIRTFFPVSS